MTAVMQGVRILEVAEHTFVPAASALLADWGAEVIKIEHVERGDAMRGLASTGHRRRCPTDVHALLEHSNRGKQSLGLDLTSRRRARDPLPARRHLATCSSPTSCPSVRTKLHIDVDDIRAHNPNIIYVRGHRPGRARARRRQGLVRLARVLGPRRASRSGAKRPEYDLVPVPPGPGFGDSIGGDDDRRRDHGRAVPPRAHRRGDDRRRVAARRRAVGHGPGDGAVAAARHAVDGRRRPTACGANPLSRNYETKDGRVARRSPACRPASTGRRCARSIGRPELATDPRFADHAALMANSADAADDPGEVFARRPLDEWRERLADFAGQWAVVQDTLEAAVDPQTVANGYVQDCETADGVPVPARRRAGAVRRGAGRRRTGAGVQRARRRDPRRARARLGHHRGPQGPRRRRLSTPPQRISRRSKT